MQKTKSIALILGVLTMSFLVGYLVLAWTEPSQLPPEGNVLAPINISTNSQYKAGALGVGGVLRGYNNAIFDGNVSTVGNLTVGTGAGTITTYKINANIIDPIFNIDGEKYATYMADYAGGLRVETSGIMQLNSEGKYTIDFDNLEKGSNLWLFWQVSNKDLDAMSVLLTSSFEGKTWYNKDGNILIIYGDKKGEVSYRLTAPRVDYKKWGNLSGDQSVEGINIFDY